MTIGNVIRKYRKERGLTQEEMAARLGVTAPAVNKWEKNHTLPDVSLLAPIARLLHITTDTLLSFREDLTDEEISLFVKELTEKLNTEPYSQVFAYARKKAETYPDCQNLLWNTAVILESWKLFHTVPDEEDYDKQICSWFLRALETEDEKLKTAAATSLYHFYMRKEDFDNAQKYLAYFPESSAERNIYQANIYNNLGKTEEAYKTYEGLLLTEFNHIRAVLNNLHILYMKENDYEMAHKLVHLEGGLAKLFEMGRYQEVSPGLELAAVQKDVEETERIMRVLLEHTDTLMDFTRSDLYRHTPFKATDPAFFKQINKDLLAGFLDEETYSFMRGNPYWEELKKQAGGSG